MTPLLFLFDTNESDLARDLSDLLGELGYPPTLIPLAPDRGRTLDQKEADHFEKAVGALFLITPGCVRKNSHFPSPSVADEMGRAKERFKANPERVLYLVDETCSIQSVDQRCFVQFRRADMRSVVRAVTQVLRNLKALKTVSARAVKVPADHVLAQTDPKLLGILMEVASHRNGVLANQAFENLLEKGHGMKEIDANLAKRELLGRHLLELLPPRLPTNTAFWRVSPDGWDVVRRLRQRSKLEETILGVAMIRARSQHTSRPH